MAELQVAGSEGKTFAIGVGEKTNQHPFYGQGSTHGFILDGSPGGVVLLSRGVSYQFDVHTNIHHDFYLSTSPIGHGTGTVTHGVEGQFTYEGVVSFTPDEQTPDIIYYQCRNHKNMGGKIYIADVGAKVDVVKDKPIVDKVEKVIKASDVSNKLMFVTMLLKSEEKKPDADAAMLEQAKGLMQQAKDAKAEDINKAYQLANDAIAVLKGKQVASQVDYAVKYQDNLGALETMHASYDKRAADAGQGGGLNTADYHALLEDAAKQHDAGDDKAAYQTLAEAKKHLSDALSKLLAEHEIVVSHDFKTAKDQYVYELSRSKSFAELIPVAFEHKHTSAGMMKMMQPSIDKADVAVKKAETLAADGKHADAIDSLMQATKAYQKVLSTLGIR